MWVFVIDLFKNSDQLIALAIMGKWKDHYGMPF